MKIFWKAIKVILLLSFGASIVLYAIAVIDVEARLAMWATKSSHPNIDPRIMYAFAMIGLFITAFVSSVVELVRSYVFERRLLDWWQLVLVGASYPLFFTGLVMRHLIGAETSIIFAIIVAAIFNPLTVYWCFNGYAQPNLTQ